MSEDKNCDLLFEYLRSILYDSQIQMLDVVKLDEPYQKLGLGLQFLERAVREMKTYSEALSRGNLSVKTPPRDNFLCENLKNIHANLNHLTWQAKQVAKGDYSQSVSYLGEFSEAFNTMTRQLQEREESFRERLLTEAYLDPLTGIGNRYFLTEQMTELLKNNKPLIFCYCDLDHLKYINDHFGHVEGDRYICHL
ncbi:MAG: diguanylate cyclase [Eubacterium ramulus]